MRSSSSPAAPASSAPTTSATCSRPPTTRSPSSTRSPTPATSTNLRRPRRRPPLPLRPGRHLRPRRRGRGAWPATTPSCTSPPRATSTARSLDPDDVRPHQLLGTNVHVRHRPPGRVERFLHISTDEVYGSIEEGSFAETDRLEPRSPYSASKAGSDLIALSYHETYGLPVRRHPLLEQLRAVPVPREGHPAVRHQPARRQARCRSTATASTSATGSTSTTTAPASTSCCARATVGEIYNIGAGNETHQPGAHRHGCSPLLGHGRVELIEYVADRLGHDRRYSVDYRQGHARSAGRRPRTLDEALEETVAWYRGQPVVVGAARAASACRHRVRVLVTGAGGQLGTRAAWRCSAPAPRGASASTTPTLDVADRDAVLGAITALRPDAVIHAAAWTAVDACEARPGPRLHASTRSAPASSPTAPAGSAPTWCYVSTDYVFDGTKAAPYVEWDRPNPQSVYGALEAGRRARARPRAGTIVRTSWVCGDHGSNMVKTILRLAGEHDTLRVRRRPARPPDLRRRPGRDARRAWPSSACPGVFHVTNQGAVSWYEFARAVLDAAGHDPDRVAPDHHRRPRPAPARRRARPTRCSTTWPGGCTGSPRAGTSGSPWPRSSPGCPRPERTTC